jgi:hypothetical protein
VGVFVVEMARFHPRMNQPLMRKLFFFAFLFLAITAARAEQVVFSEIMYHPVGDKPEFIEGLEHHLHAARHGEVALYRWGELRISRF